MQKQHEIKIITNYILQFHNIWSLDVFKMFINHIKSSVHAVVIGQSGWALSEQSHLINSNIWTKIGYASTTFIPIKP